MNTQTAYHFIRFYHPQFGNAVRNAGRVTVTAASQAEALASIKANASPTELHTSFWLPSVGCPSSYGH